MLEVGSVNLIPILFLVWLFDLSSCLVIKSQSPCKRNPSPISPGKSLLDSGLLIGLVRLVIEKNGIEPVIFL